MTDDSKIVFRWEVPDAATKYATGKVESEEFNGGGFRWAVAMSRRKNEPNDTVDFTLRCDANHIGPWKCDVEVDVVEIYINGSRHIEVWCMGIEDPNIRFSFDENNGMLLFRSTDEWDGLTDPMYHANGKATIEVQIRIIESERGEPIANMTMFDAPNNRSDIVLIIGEKKLHVSKEYLSIHSPVFEALFFGNYAEKGKDEVEINDVVYEEFRDLLRMIYPDPVGITDRTVQHILELADRFQMKGVVNQAEKFLISSTTIENKLVLADQFRLTSLRDHYLNTFTTSADLVDKLQSSPDNGNFSDAMKAAIYDRIMKLKPE